MYDNDLIPFATLCKKENSTIIQTVNKVRMLVGGGCALDYHQMWWLCRSQAKYSHGFRVAFLDFQ